MPGPLPTSRPVFLDEELRNGNFATPTLLRKMIDWCRFTYARDLPYSPCDPLGRRLLEEEVPNHTDRQSAAAAWFVPFGSFYVPDPLSPSRRLRVQIYATGTVTAGDPMEILLTSNRGLTSTLTLESAGAWVEFTVPAAPDSVVTIQARSPGTGADKHLAGICAHWEEPSSLVVGMSTSTAGIPLPSENYPAQNRPATVALARSLARWMNRITCRTVRQVVAKWHGDNYRTVVSPASWVARRYKVWVSDYADALTFSWKAYDTGTTATIKVEVTGGASTTVAASAGAASLSVTAGAGRLEETVVTISTTTAGDVFLPVFEAFEGGMTASARPLPGGESTPGSMPVLARDSIRAESSILATGETGWRDVLQAQRLVITQVSRVLVKDNDMVLNRSTGYWDNAVYGHLAPAGVQQRFSVGLADPRKARIRAAVHGRSTDSAMPFAARLDRYTGPFGFWFSTPIFGSAPKAPADAAAGFSAAVGSRVGDWPEWTVQEVFPFPAGFGLSRVELAVDASGGLYEAEWTAASVEQFIPEADVP